MVIFSLKTGLERMEGKGLPAAANLELYLPLPVCSSERVSLQQEKRAGDLKEVSDEMRGAKTE